VHFVGARSPEAFYGASDVLVLPSYYDPCANVTVEALACGLPVITSVFNGAFELLTPGVTGYCVDDASDAGQVAGYLERLQDPERLAEASVAARELALSHPLRKMYRDIIGAIEELAARPRRRGDRP
jgi:UDP-glucose:(heptosyl)LPS alpha-1,3-glucosyltransferase